MKLGDIEAIRHEIDTITPDCRDLLNGGLNASELAAIFVSSMLKGQAALLARTDIPWSDLAVDPARRQQIAREVEAVADKLLSTP